MPTTTHVTTPQGVAASQGRVPVCQLLRRWKGLGPERGCSCPGLANRHATGVTSRNILLDEDWSRISTHIAFTALGRACRKKLHKGEKSQGNPESKSMPNSRCRHIFSPNTMMTLEILRNILYSVVWMQNFRAPCCIGI